MGDRDLIGARVDPGKQLWVSVAKWVDTAVAVTVSVVVAVTVVVTSLVETVWIPTELDPNSCSALTDGVVVFDHGP